MEPVTVRSASVALSSKSNRWESGKILDPSIDYPLHACHRVAELQGHISEGEPFSKDSRLLAGNGPLTTSNFRLADQPGAVGKRYGVYPALTCSECGARRD